jgi:hypothetical protein
VIDHLMSFVDEVAAHADSVVGKYWTPGTRGNPPRWDANCSPETLVWDPAADTTATIDGPAGSIPIVTHHPIDGRFRVTITLSEPSDDLVSHPQLDLAVDHETGAVLNTRFTEEELQTLRMQPVIAGSAYPFLTNEAEGLAAVPKSKTPKPKSRRK